MARRLFASADCSQWGILIDVLRTDGYEAYCAVAQAKGLIHAGCYAHARRRFEDARLALDEGLAIVQKNDERFQEAELHRLKGELLLTEFPDRTAAAEESFRQAIEIARRQLSRAWELRATMSLSRLWQRQGRRDEARAALAAVLNTYTEGFSTPDLMDAATLIRALA